MPLPLALLSRLQKRGIIKTEQEPVVIEAEPEEEVIAEDYDDSTKTADIPLPQPEEVNENKENIVIGCPNKWNIYHECTAFCKEHWGAGKPNPSPNSERKRLRMLKKYPLPEGWDEVYDPGTGRYYYWNMNNDEVSWLPPGHPKARVTLPADKLRALMKDTEIEDMEADGQADDDRSGSESEDADEEMDKLSDDDDYREKERHRRRSVQRSREYDRNKRRENDLDPMDPAAYSDTPRGTWSTGLERKGEAKTGADTTASGPLYQMRPYPSPGAVLRMNASLKDVPLAE